MERDEFGRIQLEYANMTNIFKKHEFETVKAHLEAFINNYGEMRIERPNMKEGFYIFFPYNADNYIQYCHNVDYLDGWLYGIVQGTMRGEFKPFRTGGIKD